LLGDYYPEPAQRTRAMGVYMLAGPIASLFSFIWGGWAAEHYGWRATFFLVGIPGLLMSVLIKLTIAEPRVKGGVALSNVKLPSMLFVLGVLWRQRTSRHLGISIVLLYIMGNGLGPWYAAFLMRSHAMTTGELGVWLGLIFGLGGMAGVLLGSYVMQRWFADDERGQVRLSALTIAALVPFFVLFLLLPGKLAALLALIPVITVSAFFIGPTFALMQRLVSSEMRATTFAVVMLLANLIGMGLGPQMVGLLSDWLAPVWGEDSLRYAMLAMSLVSAWSAWHFWHASQTVKSDLLAVPGGGAI
jgi:predicted MFS family arabinose efflux permease